MPPAQRPGARADERVAPRKPLPDPRLRRLADQPRSFEVPEQVAAEDALGQRRLTRADRQMHLVRARELRRDLKAGVATAGDEDRARGDGLRRPVRGAVELSHLGVEAVGDDRRERDLKRAGGDDDLLGLVGPIVELDVVRVSGFADRTHAAPELDRQIEVTDVIGEVGRHVVPPGVAVGLAGEVQPRKAVVADRGEQLERVPALTPRSRRLLGRFEDHEVAPLPR